MLKNLIHDADTAIRYFCAADLASVWPGEVRDFNGTSIDLYLIGCRINEEVASGDGFPVVEVDVETVRNSVPRHRQAFLEAYTPTDETTEEVTAERPLYQPIPLVRDETSDTGFTMPDGLDRLNHQIRVGAQTIRCFLLTPEFVMEHGHVPLAELWSQRTARETMPPSVPPPQPAEGMEAPKVGAPVITPAHGKVRRLNPRALHPDGLSAVPAAITAATIDPTRDRVVVAVDTIVPNGARQARMRRKDQENLPVELTVDPLLIKRPARAAMSYLQLVAVLAILALFAFLRRHAPDRRPDESGHGIVSRDPRYATMVGAPKNLQDKMKVWKLLRVGGKGPWSRPMHEGLVEIGIEWSVAHGVQRPKTMYDHGLDLIDAAFTAHHLANELRSIIRNVHTINGDKAPNQADWRAILDTAADGITAVATHDDYVIYWPLRALLALHFRLNAAKIFRDTTRDTFLYEWLIAIGDLSRTRRMVVTCHMAQALFIVDDIRSVPGQEHAVAPEWDLFEQALAMNAGDPVRLSVLRRDLVLRCADAMRCKRAMVLTLPKDGACGFECTYLSLQESIYADALNLHS